MVTRHVEAEQAVLSMLQHYSGMTMDEIFDVAQPDLTSSEVFLAIDRLSRKQLIALHRTGNTYQLTLPCRSYSEA